VAPEYFKFRTFNETLTKRRGDFKIELMLHNLNVRNLNRTDYFHHEGEDRLPKMVNRYK